MKTREKDQFRSFSLVLKGALVKEKNKKCKIWRNLQALYLTFQRLS